jgi:hypothetical protein
MGDKKGCEVYMYLLTRLYKGTGIRCERVVKNVRAGRTARGRRA